MARIVVLRGGRRVGASPSRSFIDVYQELLLKYPEEARRIQVLMEYALDRGAEPKPLPYTNSWSV